MLLCLLPHLMLRMEEASRWKSFQRNISCESKQINSFSTKKKSPVTTNPACHFLYYSLDTSQSPCGTEASALSKIHCFLAKWTHLENLLFHHDKTFNLPWHLIDKMKKRESLKHSTDVPSFWAPLPQKTHFLH